MEKYGFFDSQNRDRVYNSSDIANYISQYFTNGIFNNGLQVVSDTGMTIKVNVGDANINGYRYTLDSEKELTLSSADDSQSRIDSVILRLDLPNRMITAMVLEGTYATNPGAPTITRSTTIYDLRLANILVATGTTEITQSMITDTRFSSDCGNVVGAVQQIDTDSIFEQYQNAFDTWFDEMKGQLDTDAAGHLQNEINNLESQIEDLPDIVDGYSTSTQDGYACNYVNNEYGVLKYNLINDVSPVKTGRKINSKDEYVKRVTFGTLPDATSKTVSTGLSNISLSKMPEGFAVRSTDGLSIPLGYSTQNFLTGILISDNGQNLRIMAQGDMSAYIGYVDIFFTYN